MTLSQIITDIKRNGVWEWIVEPDGNLHPNTERALLSGCWFDIEAAQMLQDFFVTFLTLPREPGEALGQYELTSIQRRFPNFNPDHASTKKPFAMHCWWHRRVIGQLYGWKTATGERRYRKGFVTTGKKSAKTTTLAALPIAELLIGDVPEKEVYVIATSEEHAGYMYRKTSAMVSRSPKLSGLLSESYSTNTLRHKKTRSVFKALPALPTVVEGIQPNLLMLDELHAWRGRQIYDALIYGSVRKPNSLRLIITTAGDDVESVAFEEYEAAKELLDPENDRYEEDAFAFVAEAGRDPVTGKDIDWQWDEPDSFIQANPTLWEVEQAIPNTMKEMETAVNTPGKKRSWIRYMCNRYVDKVEGVWIGRDAWNQCGAELPEHKGEPTWLGFDLAKTEDLVALAMAWWAEDVEDTIDLRVRFWMPFEGIKDKSQQWRVPQLHQWIADGWIETTPGAVIETNVLRRAVSGVYLDEHGTPSKTRDSDSIDQNYQVKELAYDRNLAANLVIQQLGDYDGMPVVDHAQNFPGMSEPAKEFYRRIISKRLRHDNNPVMAWMASHCVAPSDANDNIKPDKRRSRHKIDGMVASCMAVGRAVLGKPKKSSVYEERGVIML